MNGMENSPNQGNRTFSPITALWQSKDRLLQVIFATAIGLAVLFVYLYISFGTGRALADTPWYVPTMHSITGLAAFSVAFLALGRYSVLRDSTSYWIGMGFAAFGILSMFFILVWPGLLPGGQAIIAVKPNTSAWFAALELISLGSFLLAAVLAAWPGEKKLAGQRWLGSVVAWLVIVTLISIFSIVLEAYLPPLVGPQGTLTHLLLTWDWLFLLLFGLGAVLSTRCYLRAQDRLLGYVAIAQIAVAFVILTALIGAKRYDIWYYLSRIVLVGGFLTLMFGLLSEHVQLFRRVLASEARYRHLTEYLPQLIWTSTPDGRLDYLSPQWLAYTGIPEAQQLGSGWLDQIHPDDRQRVIDTWNATVAVGGILDTDFCLRRQDGTYHWFKTLALPIRDPNGRVTQWFGSCTDIQDLKRAEEALQTALAKAEAGSLMLDAIMENIPVGLTVTGGPPDFRLVRVSRYGLNLNQRPAEGLMDLPAGQHQAAWKIFLPDGVTLPRPEQMPLFRASRLGEESRNLELVMETQDGRKIPVLVNAAPVRDAQGNIIAAINTWQDITEIKLAEVALRESEERYRNLFESIDEGFCIVEVLFDENEKPVDYRFLEINPAFERQTGIQDAVGRRMLEIAPQHEEYWFEIYGKVALTGEAMRFENRAEQLRHFYEVYAFRVGEPAERTVAVLFNDITERKQAEEAQAEFAKNLERSNRDLQEFAFVASHDLQEPLRKIEAFGDLLLENPGNLNVHQRDILARMRKSANRMRSMVNGLLHLSRLETHAQPFQPVDLQQVIQEVLADLEMQIQRTYGVVDVCDLPIIDADPLQMRRLFQNLVGNALKFQPEGGKPRIRICSEHLGNGSVQIWVEDNGIGFDLEHAGHLFEPFKRLVGRSEYEGSGMGLAICRKIVERHGGNITAHSKSGQGTTFRVTLPVHQNQSVHPIRRIQDNGGKTNVSHR